MTEQDIIEIRQLRRAGWKQVAIAERIGVTQSMVSKVLLGQAWKSCGDGNQVNRDWSPSSTDGEWKYLDKYGVWVRPDGAICTKVKGVHFGTDRRDGYRHCHTLIGPQLVHRLITEAFLGAAGDGLEVNHRNGIRSDNRLANLEYVSRAENIRDAVTRQRGEVRGYRKRRRQYHARIKVNRKEISLGYFKTEQEAAEAYRRACEETPSVVG